MIRSSSSRATPSARRQFSDAAFALAIAAVFGVAVFVALAATRNNSNIAAIWPANGILLAALLIRPQVQPRILTTLLCFAANLLAQLFHGDGLSICFTFSTINILEATLACYLIRKLIGARLDFCDWDTVAKFALAAGVIAPLGPSLVGAGAAHLYFGSSFVEAFRTWFPADALGLLVVTPACVVVSDKHSQAGQNVSAKELVCHFGALTMVTLFVFGQSVAPLLFLLVPVLVSIAFRLGPRYAAIASLLITVVAVTSTCNGIGPATLISAEHFELRVWVVQVFCVLNLLTALFVAAAVADRDKLRLELERVSNRAEDARSKLDVALTHMSQGVCLFDADGRIRMRNDRFLELYNLKAQDVPLGAKINQVTAFCEAAKSYPFSESYAVDLHSAGDKDQQLGDGRVIRISQRLLADGGVVCTYTDITADKQSEKELVYRTCHDVLTDLPNRRMLSEKLHHLVSLTTGSTSFNFAVLLLDVDHFKSINDTFGHSVGDELLTLVARRLQTCVRENDLVARLGGDEFAVLLSNSPIAHSGIVASRILEAVRAPMMIDGHQIEIGLSIGIATAPTHGKNPDELLKAADIALYKAKRNGRNTFSFYSDWGVPLPLIEESRPHSQAEKAA